MTADNSQGRKIKSLEKKLLDQNREFKKSDRKKNKDQQKLRVKINGQDRELSQKTELLERIFANTHILMAYLDCSFTFIQVNNAYAGLHGRPIDYFTGKKYFSITPHYLDKEVLLSVLKTGSPHFAYAECFDDDNSYWDWSLQPVKDTEGKTEGLIVILLDVTERVRTQMELDRTREKLHKAQRLSDLGLLAATVAHELRNPLSVIQAALYNIERKKGNVPIDNQLLSIEKKIMESDQIISNLLTYAHIRFPDLQENVDIIHLLEESVEMAVQRFTDQDISIKLINETTGNVMATIDPFQIRKVFNNIVVNACQSITESSGEITITVNHSSDNIVVTFSDNGTGIKKSAIPKVFDPFFTRKSRGTGLGLAICRELILLHNGEISIDSKLHKGTKVTVQFPDEVL